MYPYNCMQSLSIGILANFSEKICIMAHAECILQVSQLGRQSVGSENIIGSNRASPKDINSQIITIDNAYYKN
ncbi:Os09g0246900 [Oryza sativa Japonica Group]|uniref:Os09g0246900 protein n=1 Tax=Oryza sativa subsp. japonica TaxID=39947 RepID=A0A0P0XJ58_ORYSJ|nr:hypothetical protein EE612_046282 [Oryza sativa]BAT07016.1 Os09g0246900 [Oryza sativa Japonica Group]